MKAVQFLKILQAMFLPQVRNSCPHCGGVKCIGLCQVNEKNSSDIKIQNGVGDSCDCKVEKTDSTKC